MFWSLYQIWSGGFCFQWHMKTKPDRPSWCVCSLCEIILTEMEFVRQDTISMNYILNWGQFTDFRVSKTLWDCLYVYNEICICAKKKTINQILICQLQYYDHLLYSSAHSVIKRPDDVSAVVEKCLLTDVKYDRVWASLSLFLSVLLTGSLQWISLLCVCLLSHCSQTCLTPEATSVCLCQWVCPVYCMFSLRFSVHEYFCTFSWRVLRYFQWHSCVQCVIHSDGSTVGSQRHAG